MSLAERERPSGVATGSRLDRREVCVILDLALAAGAAAVVAGGGGGEST